MLCRLVGCVRPPALRWVMDVLVGREDVWRACRVGWVSEVFVDDTECGVLVCVG